MTIPSGWCLEDHEIVAALRALNALKESGALGPELLDHVPAAYTISMPVAGTFISKEDLMRGTEMLNRAARAYFEDDHTDSDLLFTFKDGKMIKRGWLTLKDPRHSARLGGQKMREDF